MQACYLASMIPTNLLILSFHLDSGVASIRADAIASMNFVPAGEGDAGFGSRTIIRTRREGETYVVPSTLAEHENTVVKWMLGVEAINAASRRPA